MNTTTVNEIDIRQQERDRIQRIEATCKGAWGDAQPRVTALRAKAVAEEITYETLQSELLGILRSNRPTGPAVHAASSLPQDDLLTASLCLSCGLGEKNVAKWFGDKVTDAAASRPWRGLTLQGLLRQFIVTAGGTPPAGTFKDDSIRAAFDADRMIRARGGFSTLSLPGVLSNTANKAMLSAYESVNVAWRSFCRVARDVKDFKPFKRYRLTAQGGFTEVGADGELKSISLTEEESSNRLTTHGAILSLTRQDIINDDLSAFVQVPRILGRGGALKLERTVFETLLGNPGSFFAAGNNNLKTGAGSALASAGLQSAYQALAEQKDSNNDPILVTPKILLVPPALQITARQLTRDSTVVIAGDTDREQPSGNPWAEMFDVVTSPYLGTAAGLSGGSNTAWYLTAEGNDFAIMEVAFLQGIEAPTIESADTDFETLSIKFRGFFDFGVAMLDKRGGVKSAGA